MVPSGLNAGIKCPVVLIPLSTLCADSPPLPRYSQRNNTLSTSTVASNKLCHLGRRQDDIFAPWPLSAGCTAPLLSSSTPHPPGKNGTKVFADRDGAKDYAEPRSQSTFPSSSACAPLPPFRNDSIGFRLRDGATDSFYYSLDRERSGVSLSGP